MPEQQQADGSGSDEVPGDDDRDARDERIDRLEAEVARLERDLTARESELRAVRQRYERILERREAGAGTMDDGDDARASLVADVLAALGR
jgi:predicted nuclease with TOPRIM domain